MSSLTLSLLLLLVAATVESRAPANYATVKPWSVGADIKKGPTGIEASASVRYQTRKLGVGLQGTYGTNSQAGNYGNVGANVGWKPNRNTVVTGFGQTGLGSASKNWQVGVGYKYNFGRRR